MDKEPPTAISEETSWLTSWRFPPISVMMMSFLGPFLSFLITMLASRYSGYQFNNGSFGAAVVIMFSLTHVSSNYPRHIFLGQILSALIAFGMLYAIPSDDLKFIRVSLAVGLSSLLMKIFGISYPPACASSYIISSSSIAQWTVKSMFLYLAFPLVIGSSILVVLGLILNNLVVRDHRYPRVIV